MDSCFNSTDGGVGRVNATFEQNDLLLFDFPNTKIKSNKSTTTKERWKFMVFKTIHDYYGIVTGRPSWSN